MRSGGGGSTRNLNSCLAIVDLLVQAPAEQTLCCNLGGWQIRTPRRALCRLRRVSSKSVLGRFNSDPDHFSRRSGQEAPQGDVCKTRFGRKRTMTRARRSHWARGCASRRAPVVVGPHPESNSARPKLVLRFPIWALSGSTLAKSHQNRPNSAKLGKAQTVLPQKGAQGISYSSKC